MIERHRLTAAFDELLQPERFRDYGPNGLQVEGGEHIGTLVSGVTASLALIEAAVQARADAIFVHHGLFWRGHDGRLTGWLRRRVALLMAHNINLYAYHLPLDAQPQWGNNARLAQLLQWQPSGRYGEQDLGWLGEPAAPLTLSVLEQQLAAVLGRTPLAVPGDGRLLRRIAWCSGGAQGYFEAAIAAGADVFITGEISEPQMHLARETGVAFMACGHHATERFGAPALAGHVAGLLGLAHHFIDIDNPA